MLSDYEDMIFKQLYCQLSNSDSDLHLLLEEIFNEGLTDYRWLVEEVTYKIGYSGETVFVTISHTY